MSTVAKGINILRHSQNSEQLTAHSSQLTALSTHKSEWSLGVLMEYFAHLIKIIYQADKRCS